ncbi:hypothetical protein FIBSPDRAFT_901758 [Athelia psychrophila]|uniref:Uncharacterized protein n=1 Tax=Athelia psychrophila TaxID=1759441 RepID=A0A165WQP9_9AGAM|nr:hypothetical protein FIBSPDRAFT_901758 [Fibularhizoctonia sp. CBS 109695]
MDSDNRAWLSKSRQLGMAGLLRIGVPGSDEQRWPERRQKINNTGRARIVIIDSLEFLPPKHPTLQNSTQIREYWAGSVGTAQFFCSRNCGPTSLNLQAPNRCIYDI